eukprot:CAMPEP_0195057438 /NCGR_PEP_ID=MMETSP0448-20130528/5562_1 /TAXON_ID=66468 /ORGANISM="Heterocapsa triquestra, Strain CCMP 448" /LENGTH=51 /DNA_ID=CAMNT_0040087423 /DNA_START=56 /DNA_END=207 /DNA_ORIENTATION=+
MTRRVPAPTGTSSRGGTPPKIVDRAFTIAEDELAGELAGDAGMPTCSNGAS